MKRREFLKESAAGAAAISMLGRISLSTGPTTKVALVNADDRAKGIAAGLKLIPFPSPKGKRVFIKPNFNTADPTPAGTHNDTLRQLVAEMKRRGASHIAVGDSCGMGSTKDIMEKKGVPPLSKELGFELINFDELPPDEWKHCNPPGSHWKNGFDVARPVSDSEYLLWTCCLKTHQWGGIHSMSLKLAVGVTNRSVRQEMHDAAKTHMRRMIAEIHHAFTPQLIVMDGVDIFVDGGPNTGKLVKAGIIAVGTDRIAVDAVGLAILKYHGSNDAIMSTKIFEQEQLARAVELGLGVRSPDQIEIVTADAQSRDYAGKLKEILSRG